MKNTRVLRLSRISFHYSMSLKAATGALSKQGETPEGFWGVNAEERLQPSFEFIKTWGPTSAEERENVGRDWDLPLVLWVGLEEWLVSMGVACCWPLDCDGQMNTSQWYRRSAWGHWCTTVYRVTSLPPWWWFCQLQAQHRCWEKSYVGSANIIYTVVISLLVVWFNNCFSNK